MFNILFKYYKKSSSFKLKTFFEYILHIKEVFSFSSKTNKVLYIGPFSIVIINFLFIFILF